MPSADERAGRLDPLLAPALSSLNDLPGVETVSSCQGIDADDGEATHSEFAYVRFVRPIPASTEMRLRSALGDVAHVSSLEVRCRWSERNRELVDRLSGAVATLPRIDPIGFVSLLPLADRICAALSDAGAAGSGPALCLRCGADPTTPCRCERPDVVRFPDVPRRVEALLDRILRDRGGRNEAQLLRVEGSVEFSRRASRGDLGGDLAAAFAAGVRAECRAFLENELRQRVSAAREDGRETDLLHEESDVLLRPG